MPEEAKIFLAEDDNSTRELIRLVCLDTGHTIELEATSLEDALKNVKLAKEKRINIAVLDGSLTEGISRADGKVIAQALREEVPDIKIISFSAVTQDWGDINLTKPDDVTKLGDIVKAL